MREENTLRGLTDRTDRLKTPTLIVFDAGQNNYGWQWGDKNNSMEATMWGEIKATEVKWCGCIEASLTHFIYHDSKGEILSVCAICGKITIIARWK